MRPAEFPSEDIIAAGNALLVAGRPITGFAIRQKIGGGNPNRLKQVWDEHVASQTAAKAEPVAELPVEVAEEVATVTKSLSERIGQLATELNDKAVKAANRHVAEVVRAAGEQRTQAERELADAVLTVDDLETRLDSATSEIEALKKQLGDAQAHSQSQAIELAKVTERLTSCEQTAKANAEKHADDMKQAETEFNGLRTQLDNERQEATQKVEQLRDELAKLRERHAAMEQSARTAAELHKREQKQLTDDLKAVRGELEGAHQELVQLRERLDASQQAAKVAAETYTREIEQCRQDAAEQKAKALADAQKAAELDARKEQDLARLSAQLEAAKAEKDAARRETADARELSAKMTGQLEAMQTQNATLLKAIQSQNKTSKNSPKNDN